MAKVAMPLMSSEASGKLADAIVFFTWKGINVVRSWTKPSNPRDIDQKIARQKLASIGHFCSKVGLPDEVGANGSHLYQLIKTATPAGKIWNATIVKKVLDHCKNEANFTALSAALFGGTPASLTCWQTSATTLGLEAITGAPFATTVEPELELFMAGYGAFKMLLSGATYKYNTYPSNWTDAQIIQFVADCLTDA